MTWRTGLWLGMGLGCILGFLAAAYLASSYARARPDCGRLSGVAQLECVNRAVNRDIHAMSDLAHYGVPDRWVEEPPDSRGDCEDYALTKARRLERLGWDPERMAVGTLTTGRKEPHAVLVIDGERVLDNFSPWVGRWTDYYRPGSALFPLVLARMWLREVAQRPDTP